MVSVPENCYAYFLERQSFPLCREEANLVAGKIRKEKNTLFTTHERGDDASKSITGGNPW
jgi:hypothetical protein